MRIVSVNPNEPGIFAFGQEAVGVIAVGQMALGVVAIGQLARGVFALGQLSVGVFAVGQLAVGVRHATGMIGLGGDGVGLVLRWLPRAQPEPNEQRPQETPLARLRSGEVEEGWVRARVHGGGASVALRTVEGDGLAELSLDAPGLRTSLEMAANVGRREALVRVRGQRKLADVGSGYREGARDEGFELSALEAHTWAHWLPGRMGTLRRELASNPWRLSWRVAGFFVTLFAFAGVTLVPLLASVFGVELLPFVSQWIHGGAW